MNRHKKIFKFYFMTVFVISILLLAVFAIAEYSAYAENFDKNQNIDLGNYKASNINVDGEAVPITELPTEPGNYILTQDVDIYDTWTVPFIEDQSRFITTLDLNGHDITLHTDGFKSVIYVQNYATEEPSEDKVVVLNLMDSNQENPGVISGGTGRPYPSENGEITELDGGGIFNASSLNIYGGVIAKNSATHGGGVYSAGVTTINGGQISNNTATTGAGIYALSILYSYGGTICDNKASSTGGGMVTSVLTNLEGINILRNTACNGGGIYAEGSGLIMTNCLIEGNKAVLVENSQEQTAVDNDDEDDDEFNGSGGGLFVFMSGLTISKCTFKDNSSDEFGGAILHCANIVSYFTDTIIDNNDADLCGGGIYIFSGVAEFISVPCQFSNVQITNNTSNEGGGIFAYSLGAEFDTCNISGNKAHYMGGGINIYVQMLGSSTFKHCKINENKASVGAGLGSPFVYADFFDCEICNNETFAGDFELNDIGGGIFATFGNVTINTTKINNNKSYYGAGVTFLGGMVNMEGGELNSNNASFFSGAFVGALQAIFKSVKVMNNYADKFCAGVFSSVVPIFGNNENKFSSDNEDYYGTTIDGCSFIDNNGEALVLQNMENILTGQITISNNTSNNSCFNDAPKNTTHNSNLLLLKNNSVEAPYETYIKLGSTFSKTENIGFNIAEVVDWDFDKFTLKHTEDRFTSGYNPSGLGLVYKDFSYEGYDGQAVWGSSTEPDVGENYEIWVARDHKHTWTYEYNDNNFLAWCNDPDCEHHDKSSALVTSLISENSIYDGKPHPAKLSNNNYYYYTWVNPDPFLYRDLNIEESKLTKEEPVESGNYISVLKIDGSHSISSYFEIRRASLEPSMVQELKLEFVYDGQLKQPKFNVYDGSWCLDDSLFYFDDTQATDAGSYQISAIYKSTNSNKVLTNASYSGQITVNWKIDKGTIQLINNPTLGNDFTYDLVEHDLLASKPEFNFANLLVKYGTTKDDYSTYPPDDKWVDDYSSLKGVEVGYYYVWIKVDATDNYDSFGPLLIMADETHPAKVSCDGAYYNISVESGNKVLIVDYCTPEQEPDIEEAGDNAGFIPLNYEYKNAAQVPWNNYMSDIQAFKFGDSINTWLDKFGFKYMSNWFNGATLLKSIQVEDDTVFDRFEVSANVFTDCKSLVGGNGTVYNPSKTDLRMAKFDYAGQEGYLAWGVYFDYNFNGPEIETVQGQIIPEGKPLTVTGINNYFAPASPVWAGHVFLGWRLGSPYDGPLIASNSIFDTSTLEGAEHTFFAVWDSADDPSPTPSDIFDTYNSNTFDSNYILIMFLLVTSFSSLVVMIIKLRRSSLRNF